MTDRPRPQPHPLHRRHGEAPTGPPGQPDAPADRPNSPDNGAAAGPSAGAADTGAPGSPDTAADVDRLTAELETARGQAAELLAALQRERAEFQNFRRRTTEEREREAGLAGDSLLKKVLAIADDLDRAIEARPADLAAHGWVEGVTAIDRKLRAVLESEGVRPIEVLGKPFDPREHEAITSIPATGKPDGEVVAEIQRGYRIRDRVLRPALVAIAAGGTESAGTGTPPGGHTTNDTHRTN